MRSHSASLPSSQNRARLSPHARSHRRSWLAAVAVVVIAPALMAGETTRISVDADGTQAIGGSSSLSALSANGRFAAFGSDSADLVTGDTNGQIDAFVHDRK